MKPKTAIFALSMLLALAVTAIASPTPRQPLQPSWSQDLTEGFLREDGLTYQQILDRQRRATIDESGKVFQYEQKFAAPANAAPYGLILAFDNGAIIENLTANGQSVSPKAMSYNQWMGAERNFPLPVAKEYQVSIRARNLTQLYPNGFGRITLRPATINEALSLERIPGKADTLIAVNDSAQAQSVTLRSESTDFFGVQLSQQETQLTLQPGERRQVTVPTPPANAWKSGYQLINGKDNTWNYIQYHRPDRWFTSQDAVLPINRNWEYQPGNAGKERGPLPKDGWKAATRFPLKLTPKDKSHFIWVRTKITVPKDWQGKELFLGVPMVHFKGDFFINGQECATLHLWETPAKLNIGKWVRPGDTFELAICITDYIAAFLPGTPIPAAGIYGAPSRSLTAAVGHFPGGGIPGLKAPIDLLGESPIRTDHAIIRTHLAKGGELETALEILNNSDEKQNLTLHAQILHRGKVLHTLPVEKLRLKPGERRTLQRRHSWKAPVLWTPETPELYELRFTLKDKKGTVVDLRRERFGFRELGIDGNHFTLNGKPMRFYGFSQTTPKTMTWPAIPMAQTIYRHHFHDDEYYMGGVGHIHIGDEMGIFAKAENLSHNAHHGERFAYQDPITWERLYGEMHQVYRAVCNSPSIAFWDIGNENSFAGKGEPEKMGEFFARLTKMDPTRLITISGGFPLPEGEAVKILDTHGHCDLTRNTYFFLNPEKRPASMKNTGRYNRVAAGENPADWERARIFNAGLDPHKYTKGLLHFDNKPIFYSESMYMHAFYLPGLGGENSYFCTANNSYLMMPALLGRRYMLRFTRKADVAAVLAHVARFHGREISPVAAFTADQRLRFNANQPLKLEYDLYNFVSRSQDVTLQLTLKENGQVLAQKQKTLAMGPYQSLSVPMDFGVIPSKDNSNTDRRFDLLVEVRSAAGEYFSDWEELFVYAPTPCALPAGITLSVYDPQGTIRSWLSRRNVPFKALTDTAQWKAGANEYLIVGPYSLTKAEKVAALAKEVRKGGRILVMEHQEVPDLTAASLKTLNYNSVGLYPVEHPQSPLYGKILAQDLRFWQNRDTDLLTAKRVIKLPTKGGFRILASGAYYDGIKAASAGLIDFAVGEGAVRYSQLNLQQSLDIEPAADRVMALLINNPPAPFHTTGRAVLAEGDARRALAGRAGVVDITPAFQQVPLDKTEQLVIDGQSLAKLTPAQQKALNAWLQKGGKLLLLDAPKAPVAVLNTIAGTTIQWQNFPLDRSRFIAEHPLTHGISHGDLFWNSGKAGTNRSITVINESLPSKTNPADPGWKIPVGEKVLPLTRPAYLAALNVGKGQIVLSALRLFDSPMPEAERLLSTILTNAGVFLDPAAATTSGDDPDRDARDGWNYTPIAIDNFCNRCFKDDPASPIRGWSAQGEKDDLREFPLGKQTFRGVNFNIVDPAKNRGTSLIALSGSREIGILPAEVKDIPVKQKFQRLVFLYGSAWGAPQFTIRVQYADRKTWIPGAPDPFVDITMRPKLEIDDWYQAETYLSGGGAMTRAKLAWTGFTQASRKRDRHVGVFLYEWDNPSPEKEIDAIDILSPGDKGNGQLFILAISGANRRAMQPISEILPKYDTKRLLKQHQWSKYGVVIDKDGSLPMVYRQSDGKPLFTNNRWMIQGQIKADGKVKHVFMEGAVPKPQVEKDTPQEMIIRYQGKYVDTLQRVVFETTGLVLEYTFQVKQDPPPETKASLRLPFYISDGVMENMVNVNPLIIQWKDGSGGAIAYNPEYRWHKGYYGKNHSVAFTPFPNNFAAGAKATLSLRITLP